MLANVKNVHQGKNNTVILVENSLFVSGICTILNYHQMEVTKINIEQIKKLELSDTVYISHLKSAEMESKSSEILMQDWSTKLIIIKNNLDIQEIERLIQIGVFGVCLTDIDESYLINTINQVRDGHLFIDHRFTHKMYQEYRRLKELSAEIYPADATELKKLLTNREIEILHQLVKGYSNIQIGKALAISNKTVKNHVANILHKLEVQDRLNAVIKTVKNNWIKFE